MKKSGLFAASVAAASAYSASSSASSSVSLSSFSHNSNTHLTREDGNSNKDQQKAAAGDKFAPRFDGLRFIETLVTAHR